MDNISGNSKQELLSKALWSKGIATFKKCYSYSQNVKRDYRWPIMFILARFPIGRTLGKLFYRARLGLPDPNYLNVKKDTSIFKDLDSKVAVELIKDNGYCSGLQLPQAILKEILEYAYSAQISIDGSKDFNFKYSCKDIASKQYNREILIGNYLSVDSECSAVQKLVKDPKLKKIAAEYLGTEPVLVRCQMGWTFIGSTKAYAQKGEIGNPTVLFHYDLDDYRALKFFFYLTDVDSDSGSHRCVLGSHKKRKLRHYILRSQSDREIADYYDSENIIDVCGKAGFGFAEDPFCFHRGSPPVTAPRLIIQLEFAFNDYGIWNQKCE